MILPHALEDDGAMLINTAINVIVELKLPPGSPSLSHEELILMLVLKELATRIYLGKDFSDFSLENTFSFFVVEASHY